MKLNESNNEDQEKYLQNRKFEVNASSKVYGKLLNIYANEYNKVSEDQKKKINVLNRHANLALNFVEVDLPPLEDDKEVKLEPEEINAERGKLSPQKRNNEETGSKILLTPNKFLSILAIILPQIKAANSSNKLTNIFSQILNFLHQHNKINKKVYINLIKA